MCLQPDMGNFTVIPGSHRAGFPKLPQGLEHALTITSYTDFKQIDQIDAGVPGARQLLLEAGDAVLFHNSLWHCVPRNTSNAAAEKPVVRLHAAVDAAGRSNGELARIDRQMQSGAPAVIGRVDTPQHQRRHPPL